MVRHNTLLSVLFIEYICFFIKGNGDVVAVWIIRL